MNLTKLSSIILLLGILLTSLCIDNIFAPLISFQQEALDNKQDDDDETATATAKEPENPRLKRLTAKDCIDKFDKCRKYQQTNKINKPGDCLTGPSGFTSCH